MSISWVDLQSKYGAEYNAEYRYQTSIFIYSLHKLLKIEQNIDLIFQYSTSFASNAELNVDPVAGYSR